ncbi:MND1-interacting protein 1 [Capsicum annuum]|uniref:MND1-interacting protein 1 isoform X1 n=2 Tax=Capsicum annuum TaxID=4072 RepID=UPI0007BFC3A3|nr:MND1-interacting protein 1 isoform X1 [Capsicum annuum]KAF3631889.1 MND1-interacting protein 1 [Capsicum annuum]
MREKNRRAHPRPFNCQMPNGVGVFDDNGWGYCTEEQLEEILLKNLDYLYNVAIAKLVSLGYDEEVAMKAILRNGYCYGGMDVLTNILHNSLLYLSNENVEDSEDRFVDLRQLEEYSLAGMVCLLQQVKPHLSKGDAMWYLLMSDLHVGRASVMEIPIVPPPQSGNCLPSVPVEGVDSSPVGVGVVPAMYRFHAGWGFGNGGANEFPVNGFFSYASESSLQREIECPKRFNLTPSMKTLLKRNVAAVAAGLRANSKYLQNQSQACPSSLPGRDLPSGSTSRFEGGLGQSDESQNLKSQEVVSSVVSKFSDLKLDENSEQVHGQMDQKDEMILNLIHQIKDLERQVKERKDWAHQKAMQAARKLSNDLNELKILRMEREENHRIKKGKQASDDSTTKKSPMEIALQEASGRVDHANLTVKKLENENAEIRAEMEACKLSASESATTCLEVVRRERKCLKKLGAWEKQKNKLQDNIAVEKQKISDLQQQLLEVESAQKEVEAKWRQEQRAKKQALAQVEEERRLKETAEATNKRKLEALRLRMEIDFQRHKDDLQRLEQDLSRLKASNERPEGDVARMLHDFDRSKDSSGKDVSGDRECLICTKDEVSVVFLPCAHQVLCANCNDNYGKKGRAICPCCRVPIEQRIGVFGVTS